MAESEERARVLWLDDQGLPDRDQQMALGQAGLTLVFPSRAQPSADELASCDLVVVRLNVGESLRRGLARSGVPCSESRPVFVRLPPRDIGAAVVALRQGATHALAQDDFSHASWCEPVRGVLQARKRPGYVFADPASHRILALAERVATTEVNVLIDGPTGAGKDVVARIIHEASPRNSGPFVAFNCAALPEHLIEDTLFGHERGAFTGAVREHKGLFEQADGGTLFIDEIGDMPVHLQAKLLRVLQERKCLRLGATKPVDLDIRIIAATHRNLMAEIGNGGFREDLFFRLSTFRITVPALAERPGDILPLARHFLTESDGVVGRQVRLSSASESVLLSHSWRGNVRELQNVIQRALVMCDGQLIEPQDLVFDYPTTGMPAASEAASAQHEHVENVTELSDAAAPLVESRDHWEHSKLSTILKESRSRSEAADRLGISPRTLRYRIARLRARGYPVTA